MMNNHHTNNGGHSLRDFAAGNLPILGQSAPLKPQKWRCPRNPAHTFTGDPPAVGLPLNPLAPPLPNSFYVAQRVCVFCVLEFYQREFPVEEVTTTPTVESVGE